MNYKKLTDKDLVKLKESRVKRLDNLQIKADAYIILISEVNGEQVERFLSKLKRKKVEDVFK